MKRQTAKGNRRGQLETPKSGTVSTKRHLIMRPRSPRSSMRCHQITERHGWLETKNALQTLQASSEAVVPFQRLRSRRRPRRLQLHLPAYDSHISTATLHRSRNRE